MRGLRQCETRTLGFLLSGCGAVGSAPALGAGGREFESRYPDIF